MSIVKYNESEFKYLKEILENTQSCYKDAYDILKHNLSSFSSYVMNELPKYYKDGGKDDAFKALDWYYSINASSVADHIYAVSSSMSNLLTHFGEIQSLIDEFLSINVNLLNDKASNRFGDRISFVGENFNVTSTVVINGKKIEISMSEAMNAFYTYSGVVVSSRIEAQYMKDTYGTDIDYTNLVKNANGFMVDTIESGLYSREFVEEVLPSKEVNYNEVYSVVAGGLGITTDKFKSILEDHEKIGGTGAIGAAVVGAALLGKLNLSGNGNGGGYNGGGGGQGQGGGGQGQGGGGQGQGGGTGEGGQGQGGGTGEGGQGQDIPPQEEVVIEITKLEELDEETLKMKEEVEGFTIEKDYDDLARIEYESRGEEAIMQERIAVIQTANTLFDSPDKGALISNLEKMGYSQEEINVIISDRDLTITAFVENYQRGELTHIAQNLAAADGVTDFTTSYSSPQVFSDLKDGKSAEFVTIIGTDENVSAAQTAMNESQKNYETAVSEMKDVYSDYETSKANVDNIKAEIVKTSGEDTSKWSKEDAERYNKAVSECNEKLANIKEKTTAAKTAMDSYKKSCEDYKTAKQNFFTNSGKYVSQEFDNPLKNDPSTTTLNGQGENGLTNQGQGQGNGVVENDLSGLKIGPNGITIE